MNFPTYDSEIHKLITDSDDPVRYSTMALAINQILKSNITGSFAEVGVYRGNTSKFIHLLAPQRKLFLFDTFEGFPDKDMPGNDDRFKDTSLDIVKEALGNLNNIIIKQGYFPETAKGLKHEKFAFVMLDLDLYAPTKAGYEFFYPRLVSGGYIFAHDYNSPESNYAISRATTEFLLHKREKIIEIPDLWGSILFRKI